MNKRTKAYFFESDTLRNITCCVLLLCAQLLACSAFAQTSAQSKEPQGEPRQQEPGASDPDPQTTPPSSPLDLRREVERLGRKINELQAALAQAQRIIANLERQNELLEQQLAQAPEPPPEPQTNPAPSQGNPTTASPPSPATTTPAAPPAGPLLLSEGFIDASVFTTSGPLASPGTLFTATQLSMQDAVGSEPVHTEDRSQLSHAQAEHLSDYLRALNRWVSLRGPEHEALRGEVTWLVLFEWVSPLTDQMIELRYRVLDPTTGDSYSPRQHTLRVDTELASYVLENPAHQLYIMRASVGAKPRMNQSRIRAGYFNDPAYLGLYAEFLFELDVRAIAPVQPVVREQHEADQEAP